MSCVGECIEIGPPPDNILFLPPPPIPAFMRQDVSLDFLPLNGSSCTIAQICEPFSSAITAAPNYVAETGDYIDLARKDVEVWSGIGDTWFLVLVASSIGVLLLGALLAMFLLKCRELKLFGGNDCSVHRQMKHHENRDCASVSTNFTVAKFGHPSDAFVYQGNSNSTDNRMVWATLTPRGTQHFVSENYPHHFVDYGENEDHYETIDNVVEVTRPNSYYTKGLNSNVDRERSSFDNSAFVDYDYEDPTPLMTYQDSLDGSQYQQLLGNTDMRCATQNTMKSTIPISRPRVSSPTRIEHPNLPPLNLYPIKGNSLNKNGTLNYRNVDGGTLPKYGM